MVNVQHDCSKFGCRLEASRVVRQERQDTSMSRKDMRHTEGEHFVLNMNGMRHSQLLERIFPYRPAILSSKEIWEVSTNRGKLLERDKGKQVKRLLQQRLLRAEKERNSQLEQQMG